MGKMSRLSPRVPVAKEACAIQDATELRFKFFQQYKREKILSEGYG